MKSYAAAAVIALGILSPHFTIIPVFPLLRGEDLVLVFILLFLHPLDIQKNPLGSEGKKVRKAFKMMAVLAFASIMLGPLLYGYDLIANDFMILPMLFRYYLIFSVGQFVTDPKDRRTCLKIAIVAFTASAGIGIMQNFGLFGVDGWLTPLYSTQKDIFVTASGVVGNRVAGTHGDPRYYGYILVCALALLISVALMYPRQKVKVAALLLVIPVLLAIIFTLSRTTLYSAICITSASFIFYFRRRLAVRALGLVFLLGLGAIVFNQFREVSPTGLEAFRERVLVRDSYSYETSMHARQRDLKKPFLDAWDNPAIFLVGRGPSKSALRTDSNNDYTWYFHRFGIPGLVFYLSLLFWGIRETYRRFGGSTHSDDKIIYLSTFLVLINWAIFAMAESLWKDPQIMTINMFFLGFAFARRRPTRRAGLVSVAVSSKPVAGSVQSQQRSSHGMTPRARRPLHVI